MKRSIILAGAISLMLLMPVLLSVEMSAQTKEPTRQEVAEYIKLLDAKITFNRAQGNTAKVKELQTEKNRTLSRWKAIQQRTAEIKKPAAAPAVKTAAQLPATQQAVRARLQSLDSQIASAKSQGNVARVKSLRAEKQRVVKHWQAVQKKQALSSAPAVKTAAQLPSTQQAVRARLQSLDSQIASAKSQGNVARVKSLRAEKQRVVKHWQAVQRRQSQQQRTAKPKTAAAAQLTELEGPIGTWLNNGHTAFRVINTEKKDTDPRGQKPPAGTVFYVVTAEIKNKDPFTAVYGGDYHRVMVIDANRVYYMENVAKNPANWADNDDIRELMPAETFQTAYVFTVPEEAVPDKLVFDVSSADKYPVIRVLLR